MHETQNEERLAQGVWLKFGWSSPLFLLDWPGRFNKLSTSQSWKIKDRTNCLYKLSSCAMSHICLIISMLIRIILSNSYKFIRVPNLIMC